MMQTLRNACSLYRCTATIHMKFYSTVCSHIRCSSKPVHEQQHSNVVSYLSRHKRQFSSVVCNDLDELPADDDADVQVDVEDECFSHLNDEQKKRLLIIALECSMLKQSGNKMPSKISNSQFLELLTRDTKSQRTRLLTYYFKTEKKKEGEARKKAERRTYHESQLAAREGVLTGPFDADGCLQYGLSRNTINLYVRESTMIQFDNWKLAHAMLHGPHLVFDMDFAEYMQKSEITNTAWQIHVVHGLNKAAPQPFHIHMCNVRPDDPVYEKLKPMINGLDTRAMITVSRENYLDLYPKNKLVYLSPNAPNYMETFDDDLVYIIGGFVDKSKQLPLTMAKAKKEGLRMEKFPLDKYVRWGMGKKNLALNQVLDILLSYRQTRNWTETLTKYLPKRKLWDGSMDRLQKQRKREMMHWKGRKNIHGSLLYSDNDS